MDQRTAGGGNHGKAAALRLLVRSGFRPGYADWPVMHHLVYISSATELFDKSALLQLLEQAREKNKRLGISGILLYRDGNILQTLEGDQAVVEELFQTIVRDPRHTGVSVLLRGAIEAREFPDWSMAFRDLSIETEATLPGFSPFLNTPLSPAHERARIETKRCGSRRATGRIARSRAGAD